MNKKLSWLLVAVLAMHKMVFASISEEPVSMNSANIYKWYTHSIGEMESKYRKALDNGDTTGIINTLIQLGDVYSHRSQYAKSYDYFWDALQLADAVEDSFLIAEVHSGIAWLYSFYERKDVALQHFNTAIAIKKEYGTKERYVKELISEYYGITTLYRELGEIQSSKRYLDSCYLLFSTVEHKELVAPYLDAELAYHYVSIHDYWEAINIMNKINSWFEVYQPTYLVILNTFRGDAYKGLGKFKLSEAFYKKALDTAFHYKSHTNYIPTIYKRLSDLYVVMGDYKNAYNSLNKYTVKSEELFDSRSINNRPLLEITDEFRKSKEERKLMMQSQKLHQLEQEKRINVLRNVILLFVLAGVILFWFLYTRYLRVKHNARVALNNKERELEMEKSKELLDLKNKELASSALQLIEKDKMLQDLKEHIGELDSSVDIAEVKRLFKTISVNSKKNWEEFEARFIEVNERFYSRLKSLHPDLTPGDLKTCALIKLNFDSKEMARLMGIGTESVHTIRYRLRRKLGLTRKNNLTEYLLNMDAIQNE